MKNHLRNLRAAREWSQSDLADKLVAKLLKMPIEDIFDPMGD